MVRSVGGNRDVASHPPRECIDGHQRGCAHGDGCRGRPFAGGPMGAAPAAGTAAHLGLLVPGVISAVITTKPPVGVN